jgi:hypothetical protein
MEGIFLFKLIYTLYMRIWGYTEVIGGYGEVIGAIRRYMRINRVFSEAIGYLGYLGRVGV